MRKVEVIAVEGIPEVRRGDDVARLIQEAIRTSGLDLREGDVLVVSQKVVSKAEGRVIRSDEVEPSPFAVELSKISGKKAEHVEVILRNTARVVRMDRERGIFIMETPHGLVCANAGVDTSNVGGDAYTSLPVDPDGSASKIRSRLEEAFGVRLAVIVTDTFGRPWRRGQTDVAIGVSGMNPLRDYRGARDAHGQVLRATMIAMADEAAAAGELVKGKADGIPVAIVRGLNYEVSEGTGKELIRDRDEDLFR
jgi:coenzyme F420-0:L-glutamate ligase/coenzyme F420-1:gamma-L-glutamate ligase